MQTRACRPSSPLLSPALPPPFSSGGVLAIVIVAACVVLCAAEPAAAVTLPGRVSPDLSEISDIPQHGRTYVTMIVLCQLALILVAAKLLGWLA